MKKYELIILGAGAAGFSAAIKANELETDTLMVNNEAIGLGGTCVNVGCLPTKHLLHVADLIYKFKNLNQTGLKGGIEHSFREIMENKDRIVNTLRREKYEDVLKNLGHVDLVIGDAVFKSKDKIEVNGEVYQGKKFLISTGSSTFVPPIEGLKEAGFLTNVTALSIRDLPESILVLGGGPLGVEFSQIFSRFGSKVTVVEVADRIVSREEHELANMLKKYLIDEGVKVYTETKATKVEVKGGKKIVHAYRNGEMLKFEVDEILVATGRRPNTDKLNLDKVNVKTGRRGEILVDEYMQAAGNIWAAGDVTGEPMLETVAAREGMIAANNALTLEKVKMDYNVIPHAVFTDPQLAGVGLTEHQAKEQGIKYITSTIEMKFIPKAVAINDIRGATKIIAEKETRRIIGVHMLSSGASDIIHEAVMIIKNNLTIEDVVDTLHIFPTLSEAIKITAQSFKRDITKISCCVE